MDRRGGERIRRESESRSVGIGEDEHAHVGPEQRGCFGDSSLADVVEDE